MKRYKRRPGDKVHRGQFGDFTAGMSVSLGGPFKVNKDNMDDFTF